MKWQSAAYDPRASPPHATRPMRGPHDAAVVGGPPAPPPMPPHHHAHTRYVPPPPPPPHHHHHHVPHHAPHHETHSHAAASSMYRPSYGQPPPAAPSRHHATQPPMVGRHYEHSSRYYDYHGAPSYSRAPPPPPPPSATVHVTPPTYGGSSNASVGASVGASTSTNTSVAASTLHSASTPTTRGHYPESPPEPRCSPPRELHTLSSSSPPPIDRFRTGGCTCKKSRCLKLYCQCFALSTTCGPKCKCQTCHNTPLHAEAIAEARKTILERNPSAFDDKFRGSPAPSPYRAPSSYASPPHSAHTAPVGTVATASPPAHSPSWHYAPTSHPSTVAASHPRTAMGAPPPPPRVNKFGCKCRRSFCLKKYCECYQNSVHCGLNCRCINCKNFPKNEGPPPPPAPAPAVPTAISASSSPRSVSDEAGVAVTAISSATNATAAAVAKTADTAPPVAVDTVDTSVAENTIEKKPTEMPVVAAADPEKKPYAEDRMAIMAAVAMTELLGKSPRRVSIDASKAGESKRKAEESEESSGELPVGGERVCKKVRVEPTAETNESPVRPVLESRNPSPVSVATPHHTYVRSPYPPSATAPPPAHVPPHQRPHPVMHHQHHRPHHVHAAAAAAAAAAAHHRHHRPIQSYPYYPSPPPRASPTYEDVIRSSGLPKSLSFRKICSKCGKTRGEHGELGFGNKCVYQDCGKCGAGIQMHIKAGTPMGILCRLTVEEGATPGAAENYERKIRDLAARAELQKTLMEDKRERAERLAQIYP